MEMKIEPKHRVKSLDERHGAALSLACRAEFTRPANQESKDRLRDEAGAYFCSGAAGGGVGGGGGGADAGISALPSSAKTNRVGG
jgi:hypothetical protein